MTKNDFERLAAGIRAYSFAARCNPALGDCKAHLDLIVDQIALVCGESNPLFQYAKFRAACRLED